MNFYFFSSAILLTLGCGNKQNDYKVEIKTICNPINISYRFQLEAPSRREAADPTVIIFKNEYWLFASKSGGYWHSSDLVEWIFIKSDDIPTEEYAPTAIVIKDTIYFLASSDKKSTIYKSADPKSGKWMVEKDSLPFVVWDPAFFQDDNERLYLYWGCSNNKPLYAVELEYKNNFTPIGEPIACLKGNPENNGWENRGDNNTITNEQPWIEGSWMNKYKGKYYLQYAGPGTEYRGYADGVYISDNPLGPFSYADNNPFSLKHGGFLPGAGHGCTFQDKYGNFWHIATATISMKHIFERRLAIFPTFFDADGILMTDTKCGDYPMIMPQKKISSYDELFPGWMLLSYKKQIETSPSIDSLLSSFANDENIRTYWSAKSGDSSEWISIDLGSEYDVYAVQINFAEHNSTVLGRMDNLYYQYLVEYSNDKKTWATLIDKTTSRSDFPHDYIPLKEKIKCRYIKLKNIHVADGNFAISDLRIFGKGTGQKPEQIENMIINRNPDNKRSVELKWNRSKNATGYIVNYGYDKNKLYHSQIVYQDTMLRINSLNKNQPYYFSIEAFNETGIAKSKGIYLDVQP